ncbi:MAG: hypothetical protein F4133_13195 [Gammaproteobacteria bacterium]|nr:hypothetical protein [Gammaproteobacteria bacterium]
MSELFLYEEALGEIQKNVETYKGMKEQLERNHMGEVALFHSGVFIRTFNDSDHAYDFGCEEYGLGRFSVKKIGEKPLNMGAMTPFVKHLD